MADGERFEAGLRFSLAYEVTGMVEAFYIECLCIA
jgi:hypothetical protein